LNKQAYIQVRTWKIITGTGNKVKESNPNNPISVSRPILHRGYPLRNKNPSTKVFIYYK